MSRTAQVGAIRLRCRVAARCAATGACRRAQRSFGIRRGLSAGLKRAEQKIHEVSGHIRRVITAQQAHAYKPSLAIFRYAWQRLGCTPDHALHVAQDFGGDLAPAAKLGVTRVRVNRFGKRGDPAYAPDHELFDLSGLPRLLGL